MRVLSTLALAVCASLHAAAQSHPQSESLAHLDPRSEFLPTPGKEEAGFKVVCEPSLNADATCSKTCTCQREGDKLTYTCGSAEATCGKWFKGPFNGQCRCTYY